MTMEEILKKKVLTLKIQMGRKCPVKPRAFFFFFPVWHFRARYQTQGVILYTMSNICCGSFHRQATVMLFFCSLIHSLTETAEQLLRASHHGKSKGKNRSLRSRISTGQMDYYKWPWACILKQLLFKSSPVPKMFSSSPCT